MLRLADWYCLFVCLFVWLCLTPFSTIWRSVLLMEETGGPGENHRPVASRWQIYHIMLYTSPWSRFELTTLVVIGTDCICSCKSNYHTITATTVPADWFMYTFLLKMTYCIEISGKERKGNNTYFNHWTSIINFIDYLPLKVSCQKICLSGSDLINCD